MDGAIKVEFWLDGKNAAVKMMCALPAVGESVFITQTEIVCDEHTVVVRDCVVHRREWYVGGRRAWKDGIQSDVTLRVHVNAVPGGR